MIQIPIGLLISFVFFASCASFLLGDYIGWRHGVVSGYGALKWPDSKWFGSARTFLNRLRIRDGLSRIEDEAA